VVNALVCTLVQAKLGKLANTPTLSMFGGADECVPPAISAHALQDRMAAVLSHPLSQAHVIEGAGHSLEGHEQEAVNVMIDFVKSVAS
jgi:pimeloyl-ACP methyl ester carboxylesterase